MIKKLLLAVAIALPMCVSAQAKFGYMNSQEIFNVMPEKATAENTLKGVAEKYESEYQKLQEEFNKNYAEFKELEKDANTPQSIKERRQQELQEKYNKINNFQQTAAQDIEKQQQTLMAPIQDKLQKAIQSVGAENGFTFIFDLAVPSVAYSGTGATDVTALIKAKLGIK